MAKVHKDIEFMVEDRHSQSALYFKDPNEAAGVAIARAISHGDEVTIDVLAWSEAGAKAYAGTGDYEYDSEASVHERIVVKAESLGKVP